MSKKSASARSCRWAITLMTLDYDVVYQESRLIPHADTLSRLQFQTNGDDELEATNFYREVNVANCKAVFLSELKTENSMYPLIHNVKNRIIC